jgi:hypothetical protein
LMRRSPRTKSSPRRRCEIKPVIPLARSVGPDDCRLPGVGRLHLRLGQVPFARQDSQCENFALIVGGGANHDARIYVADRFGLRLPTRRDVGAIRAACYLTFLEARSGDFGRTNPIRSPGVRASGKRTAAFHPPIELPGQFQLNRNDVDESIHVKLLDHFWSIISAFH